MVRSHMAIYFTDLLPANAQPEEWKSIHHSSFEKEGFARNKRPENIGERVPDENPLFFPSALTASQFQYLA